MDTDPDRSESDFLVTQIKEVILGPERRDIDDTIWMTQMSGLYATDTSGISRHISRIYADGELAEIGTSTDESKLQKMQNTQSGFKKPKKYYNLQVIIAVGFKVNSPQATAFRTWANSIIDEYSRV